MLCPKDNNQLIQDKTIGLGHTDIDFYDTMEVKICPFCKTRYIEIYSTFEIEGWKENLARLTSEIASLIWSLPYRQRRHANRWKDIKKENKNIIFNGGVDIYQDGTVIRTDGDGKKTITNMLKKNNETKRS